MGELLRDFWVLPAGSFWLTPLYLFAPGIDWIGAHCPLSLSLYLPLPVCGGLTWSWPSHGSALPPVERASSSGKWCAGPMPTVLGSARGTSQTPSRCAACLPAEVSQRVVEREKRQPETLWPRPETQPGLHPSPLEIPSSGAASPCSQEISRTLQ